ncbi:MAG: ComEC family competence protein [Bacteroidales bacterium]|nr:ComEC family competence protein [Bacteroidales bacterium]
MKPKLSAFNYFPFLRFSLAFIVGIILEEQFEVIGSASLFILLGISVLLVILSVLLKKSPSRDYYISIMLVLAFVGLGISYTYSYKKNQFKKDPVLKGIYAGIVQDKAPSTNNRWKYTVNLECSKTNTTFEMEKEKILLYVSDSISNTKIEPGDEIIFMAQLREISNSKNPGEFDFKKYSQRNGIRYQTYVYEPVTKTGIVQYRVKTIALNLRTKLMKLYREAGIDGDEYAVLGALTLGDTNYISNEVRNSFAASGAMHVLSVSGLHVGIIFIVLNFLFSPMNKKPALKPFKVLFLLLSLWFYAFITGLSPSVLRSASMFSFLVIGDNLNRRTNTYNTLAVSACLLLLINPLTLFNIGFQLSYLAVASIVFFQPKFSALITTKNKASKYLWDLITVSLAAQLGTTPISILYFHQFPSYFLLSNIIVVPAAAIILYLGMAFFFVSFIPGISHALAFLLKYTTYLLNHSIQFIENLPGSVIDGIYFTFITSVFLYLLIISISAFFITKKGRNLAFVLCTLVLLQAVGLIKDLESITQRRIIVYNNYSEPLVSIINGKDHYYYSPEKDLEKISQQLLETASMYYRTQKPVALENNHIVPGKKLQATISYANLKIEICQHQHIEDVKNENQSIKYDTDEQKVSTDWTKIQKSHSLYKKYIDPMTNEYDLKKYGALIINIK